MPCRLTAATWRSSGGAGHFVEIEIVPGDWQRLGSQPVSRTALQRSRFVSWSPGHFELEHLHAVSDQLALVAEGNLLITAGQQDLDIPAGMMVWLPRGCRHCLIAGDSGCRFWEVVAPNREPHTTTGVFPESSQSVKATVAELSTDLALPASEDLSAEIVHLNSGVQTPEAKLDACERLLYVLHGSVDARVRSLSGTLEPHTILHVSRHYEHQLEGRGEGDSFVLQLTMPAV